MNLRVALFVSTWLGASILQGEGAEAGTAEGKTVKEAPTPREMARSARGLATCIPDRKRVGRKIIDIAGVGKGLFLIPVYGKQTVNFLVVDKQEELSLALAKQSNKARIYLVGEKGKAIVSMRKKIDKEGMYGRITCRAEKLESIFFPSFFFDAVIVNQTALNERGFREVYRLLKPGKMAFFLGGYDIEKFFENTEAPGVETTRLAKAKGVTILHRGYDETENKYLTLPLTRLWVTVADQRMIPKADKIPAEYIPPGNNYPGYTIGILRGQKGEVITDTEPNRNFGLFQRVPLDAYTGNIVRPEPEYGGREMEIFGTSKKKGIDHSHSILLCSKKYYIRRGKQWEDDFDIEKDKTRKRDKKVSALLKEFLDLKKQVGNDEDPRVQKVADRVVNELVKMGVPPPYQYQLVSYHGEMGAKDPKTGEWIWKNSMNRKRFWSTCCPLFRYANGVVYKTTYRSLLALHPLTGKLLWWHRNGGNCCAQLLCARSVVYQPNVPYFMSRSPHLQTFISKKYAGNIPEGDRLTRGRGRIKGRSGKISPADWPMYHYDMCRTGVSPDQNIRPPLRPLWKFATGGKVRSSPAVVGGTVYVGSCDNKFYALDAETGRKKWTFFADDAINSSPCVWKTAVYFGCDDGKIYALDRDSGELIWAYKTATTAPLTLHYQYRTKYVRAKTNLPSRSFTPLCFNGQPLSTPGVVRASPVVARGVLYAGTGLGVNGRPCWGYLYALDAATGKLIWKITEPDIAELCEEAARGITSPPCFYDNRVHFTYGVYTAVGAKDGKVSLKGGTIDDPAKKDLWKAYSYINQDKKQVCYRVAAGHADGWGVRGAVTIAGDKRIAILVSGPCDREGDRTRPTTLRFGSRVWAVDMSTGRVKWEGRYESDFPKERRWTKFPGPLPYEEPANVHNGRVYVAGDKGIAVFDLEKGGTEKIDLKLRWKPHRLRGYYSPAPWDDKIFKPLRTLTGPADVVFTSPAIANGFIFAGADDGSIYAWNLDEKAGKKEYPHAWSHKLGEGIKVRSSPAIAQGRLYIGADDGYIYCFVGRK